MGSNVQHKFKRFLTLLIIIVPIVIVSLWFLFPEPDLMLINTLSSSVLSLEDDDEVASVLEETKAIITSHGSLPGVSAETIALLNSTVSYVDNGLFSLRFVFDNSLFLTKTDGLKANLSQTKEMNEALLEKYSVCRNYLDNNFKPHLESSGVTGTTVNEYFLTYKTIFADYAVAFSSFNNAAFATIDEAGTRTVSFNTLSIAAFKVKIEWENLCLTQLTSTAPNANFAQIQTNYTNFKNQDFFSSNFTSYYPNVEFSNKFYAAASRTNLSELLTVFSTPAQAEFVAALDDETKVKINEFFTSLTALTE